MRGGGGPNSEAKIRAKVASYGPGNFPCALPRRWRVFAQSALPLSKEEGNEVWKPQGGPLRKSESK